MEFLISMIKSLVSNGSDVPVFKQTNNTTQNCMHIFTYSL